MKERYTNESIRLMTLSGVIDEVRQLEWWEPHLKLSHTLHDLLHLQTANVGTYVSAQICRLQCRHSGNVRLSHALATRFSCYVKRVCPVVPVESILRIRLG